MLRLSEQVGGAHLRIRRVVGNDQRLGRARQKIDADAAEQLPLRLRDERIARTDQHVDCRYARGAERHRRNRLDAAEQIDLVGATQRHRGNGGGRRHAVQRRRAGGDTLHAGDLRGQHAHMRGRDHRIAAAGHITADTRDRNVLVAKPNAGQRLHLDVAQCGALHLGKAADLRLGELDVLDHLRRQAIDQRLNFCGGQAEILRLPLVELHGQLAHCRIAASHDVIEDRLDRLAHLTVGRELLLVGSAPLEITDHRTTAP